MMRRFFPSTIRQVDGLSNWLSPFNTYFAWSVRQPTLDSNLCIRVKRSSDNTNQEFNWVSGEIDIAGIQSFVGASDGCVQRIYSSLNALDYFYNETGSNEPRIIVGGTLQIFAGKPTLYFDGGRADYLLASSNFIPTNPVIPQVSSITYSWRVLKTGGSILINNPAISNRWGFASVSGGTNSLVSNNYQTIANRFEIIVNEVDQNPTTWGQVYTLFNGERLISETNIGFPTDDQLRLGNQQNASFKAQGNLSDFITWNSVKTTSELKSVQQIMNNYYGIYS